MKNEHCLNCGENISEDSKYCVNCGQKNRKNILSIKELFRDFFDNVLNLDFSLLKSLLWIWVPAYLTKQYVSGKRLKYFNPFRLLFLALVLHIATIAFALKDLNINRLSKNIFEDVDQSKLLESFDAFIDTTSYTCSIPLTDSIRHTVFKNVNYPEQDTFDIPSFNFLTFDSTAAISKTDLLELPIDSLYQKIGAKTIYDKIALKQIKRAILNPNTAFSAMISNLLWVGLLIVFIAAIFLKLLYIRHDFYYIEHAVLLIYHHSAMWFLLSIINIIAFMMNADEGPAEIFVVFGLIASLIFLYFSLKKYYQQGYIKTFIKWFLFLISYIIILSALIVIIAIASFIAF